MTVMYPKRVYGKGLPLRESGDSLRLGSGHERNLPLFPNICWPLNIYGAPFIPGGICTRL